eukprot:scaffold14818_cov147-Amphora_coffeaeformis.AAC.4
MRRSSTEPVYFRAQAYFLAGLCHFSDWDREAQAVKYFDKAPWLYGSANEAEKNRWVFLNGKIMILGYLYEKRIATIERLTYFTQKNIALTAWHPTVPGEHILVSHSAGVTCDYCAKRRDELGMECLLIYSVCRKAFYCSVVNLRKPGKNTSTGKPAADPRATFDKRPAIVQLLLLGDDPDLPSYMAQPGGWILVKKRRAPDKEMAWVHKKHLKPVCSAIWYTMDKVDLKMIADHLLGLESKKNNCAKIDEATIPHMLPHTQQDTGCESDDEEDTNGIKG